MRRGDDQAASIAAGVLEHASVIQRSARIDRSLLDGPVMDRGGVICLRVRTRPDAAKTSRTILEMFLTDRSGTPKRERTYLAILYESPILVTATFQVRLDLRYRDLEDGRVRVTWDPNARKAQVKLSSSRDTLDVTADVREPAVGRTPEYDEFLDAPPDEQREIPVAADGAIALPPAVEDATARST